MKTQQLVLAVVGIAALVIAFLVGRSLRVAPAANPTDRLVTISASPTSPTECEVDYPVASLRQNVNHMQWASTDKQYWVSFMTLGETIPNYTPEDPLRPQPANDTVVVPANSSSGRFNVQFDSQPVGGPPKYGDPNYYMYAIYDHDPTTNPNNPCKKASVEHDTGVIVKR